MHLKLVDPEGNLIAEKKDMEIGKRDDLEQIQEEGGEDGIEVPMITKGIEGNLDASGNKALAEKEGSVRWTPNDDDWEGIRILNQLYPKLDLEMCSTLYMADKNGMLDEVLKPDYKYKHHKDEYYTKYKEGEVLKTGVVDNTNARPLYENEKKEWEKKGIDYEKLDEEAKKEPSHIYEF